MDQYFNRAGYDTDPKSQVFRNAIRQKQILFGPMNMSYYEVNTGDRFKKIITLGEIHTPGLYEDYAYNIEDFAKAVFQKGLDRKKCVDFFLEEDFDPRKNQFGVVHDTDFNIAQRSKYYKSLTDLSKLNTLAYTRRAFKDCHTSEGDCFIDGKRYKNVRLHRWDLRQIISKTCEGVTPFGASILDEKIKYYYFHSKFTQEINFDSKAYPNPDYYVKKLIYWFLDLLNPKEGIKFVSETLNWLYEFNVNDQKTIKCDWELFIQIKRLIKKQFEASIGIPGISFVEFKRKLADSIYYFIIREIKNTKDIMIITLIFTDIYLFLRMFRRFASENQKHANHIILYAGDAHTHNINHLIEEFYGKHSLIYQTHITEPSDKAENKYVIMDPSYNKYPTVNIKNVDDLIERFLS